MNGIKKWAHLWPHYFTQSARLQDEPNYITLWVHGNYPYMLAVPNHTIIIPKKFVQQHLALIV